MSKEEILKKIVIDIWKTIKLNDPPSWTEKQQQEWLVNRLEEALDTMRDETLGEVEKTGKRYKSERYKTDQFVIPGKKWDKLKTKPKETKE